MPEVIYYQISLVKWVSPLIWLDNAETSEVDCRKELVRYRLNRVGLDESFVFTFPLFFMIGMGFGTSFSTSRVDCLLWVHTGAFKRAVRGLLGVTIAGGMYWALY